MKVICAPDSFKESLTAAAAAQAMALGVQRAQPDAQVDLCPISDGGEGFVDSMLAAVRGRGRPMVSQVCGPLGRAVAARWGLLEPSAALPRTAVVEMAAASGLELVPQDQRDPTKTTTYGTGQLIREAVVNHECQCVLVGIGGSATCDGGCGMAQACGVNFFDDHDDAIDQPLTGGMLHRIKRLNVDSIGIASPALCRARIIVACDVKNPLTGPNGAAHVYGPQKGATPKQVELLDAGLAHLAKLWRDQLGVDVQQIPGAGAAGGLGGGLVAFVNAQLRPGIDIVLETVGFRQRVADCDLCLTGEGKLDGQSLSGKACLGVAQAAARCGVATVALVGALGPDAGRTLAAGLSAYHVIGEGLSADESMRRAAELLESAAQRVVRQWLDERA